MHWLQYKMAASPPSPTWGDGRVLGECDPHPLRGVTVRFLSFLGTFPIGSSDARILLYLMYLLCIWSVS